MNRNLETLIFSAALCFAACQAQAVQFGGNTQTTNCYQGPSGECCPPYTGSGCFGDIHNFDDGGVIGPLDPEPYDPPIYPPPPPPPVYPPINPGDQPYVVDNGGLIVGPINPGGGTIVPNTIVNPVVSCGPHGLVESYDHVSCLLRN